MRGAFIHFAGLTAPAAHAGRCRLPRPWAGQVTVWALDRYGAVGVSAGGSSMSASNTAGWFGSDFRKVSAIRTKWYAETTPRPFSSLDMTCVSHPSSRARSA